MTNINTASGAVIPRYKIGYRSDEWGMRSSTPGGVSDPAGQWVRYDDHIAALASAAAPQPNTACAALPAECDSPELCAVSRSCAGQFGTKRICASRWQAPAQQGVQWQCGPQASGFTAPQADSVTAPAATCPTCKAPCTTTVNMRGGEHGWGTTDLERTVYRYAPTQAADSVLEDAARYRHIRDVPHSEEVRSVLSLQQNAVMDKVIDKDRAAMAAKRGGQHD